MGFDDIFEHGNKHNKHDYSQQSRHSDYYSNKPYADIKQQILYKLQSNPKLRTLLIVSLVILVVVIVFLAILLIPLAIKLLHFVSQNGIQGVIDTLWNGTK